jgi:hypothetical protein
MNTEVLETHLDYAHHATAEALNEAMLFDWEPDAPPVEWEMERVSVLAKVIELLREVQELKGLLDLPPGWETLPPEPDEEV